MKNFALIGVGGYIAPRHLNAIKKTGNRVVACLDKNDSVGIIDSYFPDASFFTEFERFDRHVEKVKNNKSTRIDYVSICSPNYLHDAHVRFALRYGADVICEKPLVLNPWNIKPLRDMEKDTGRKINTILQLRLHPSLIKIKKEVDNSKDKIFNVDLTYVTSRGRWYFYSWKGDIKKSGGIATNIGIHFFDMLTWIFGKVKNNIVHVMKDNKAAGYLELEKANVRWFLSLDENDLPYGDKRTYRSIMIDNKEIEFSDVFTELHLKSYEHILQGKGFGVDDVLSTIGLVSDIRYKEPIGLKGDYHPLCK